MLGLEIISETGIRKMMAHVFFSVAEFFCLLDVDTNCI